MTQTHISVKTGGRTVFVPVPEIDYIESAANYIVIHSKEQSYVLRGTLSNITERLPSTDFVRISRAAIVKTTFLAEVRQTGRRERQALMRNGKALPMTRSAREIRNRIEGRGEPAPKQIAPSPNTGHNSTI